MASSSSSGYLKFHEIHARDLLLSAERYLKWGDGSGDIAMDVGCGEGTNSTQRLAELFPNVQKIIAIDIGSSTIEVAKQNFPHPKIEYCVADIEDRSTLTAWKNKITKLFSVNCFLFLSDQAAAFKNVYRLLAPGGEAAIKICLQSNYFDAYMDLKEQAKWKKPLKHFATTAPESHIKQHGASHYLKILKKIGFQVVVCQEEDKEYLYQSEAACRKAITDDMMVDCIRSDDQKEEFKQAIFDTFIKYSTGSSQHPRQYDRVLLVLVRKLETAL